jgi:hypothetical protein
VYTVSKGFGRDYPVISSVKDPHRPYADPDPAFYANADPALKMNADPCGSGSK